MNYREKMREQINKYPYGEYYGLKPNQPKEIIRLLNEINNADKYIKKIFFEKENLQSKIDKANEILEEILVVRDWEHEGRFRPVKGTTAQDVYKTIIKLNELLETPRKINYELLKEDK